MQNETSQQLSPDSILSSDVLSKIETALKSNDLQGALQHSGDLVAMIRGIADPSVKRKVDIADTKSDVIILMGLARKLRHAHSEDYDNAYKNLQTALYDVIAKQHWPRDHAIIVEQASARSEWKFQQCIEKALEEPSIDKAVNFACIWECERAMAQARRNNFKSWDTCFEHVIYQVKIAWMQRERMATR